MPHYSIEEFRDYVKNNRDKYMDSPFELAYNVFIERGYDKKPREYFYEHASEYIEDMRKNCWEMYKEIELEFTSAMLAHLIDKEEVNRKNPFDAVMEFTIEYPEHIYDLSLSNTQSRRSRAGKEFEAILQLMLIGCDISNDAQGAIGKQTFQKEQLGKLVDFITPGVTQYLIDKRNTVLISAKTTLRERWQEVPEEVSRTGIREIFLATLDDEVSADSLKIMYEANVIVVTTKMIKAEHYADNVRVMTMQEMLRQTTEIMNRWNGYPYSDEDKSKVIGNIQKQIEKYGGYPYVLAYYQKRLKGIK